MHQPTIDYWAKHFLIEGKGCSLCGNIGILQTTFKKQTFCICPNGQHLREQIESIKLGETCETETCIKESQGHVKEHKQAHLSVAHVQPC